MGVILRILALWAAAAPLPTLRYAGTLSDAQGRPLQGSYLLDFRIFEGAGSRAAWSESRYVKAEGGRFSALLGQRRPLPDAVLRGAYRLVVAAPPGTGWNARAESLPALDRPVAAEAEAAPAPSQPAAEEEAAEESPATQPQGSEMGRLERELERAKEEAAEARKESQESRKRLDALERAPAAPAARPGGTRVYTVRPGDTLRSVAAQQLGDEDAWVMIYQANSDRLERAGELTPGQKLVIPATGP